jgi:uncharacterized lipoprotein YmbA
MPDREVRTPRGAAIFYCALLLSVLLTACASSPPVTYLNLSAGDGERLREDATGLSLGPVEIDDHLKRNGLARRDTAGALRYSREAFWAEPLDRAVQTVLLQTLRSGLPQSQVTAFPEQPAGDKPRAAVTLTRLEATPRGVLLAARWTWQPAGDGAVTAHQFQRERSSAAAPTEVARNLSHLVHALAAEIAASLPAAPTQDATAR